MRLASLSLDCKTATDWERFELSTNPRLRVQADAEADNFRLENHPHDSRNIVSVIYTYSSLWERLPILNNIMTSNAPLEYGFQNCKEKTIVGSIIWDILPDC